MGGDWGDVLEVCERWGVVGEGEFETGGDDKICKSRVCTE